MGKSRLPPNIAGALFTNVQQRVLALLFGEPDRSFYAAEIIRRVRSGTGAVQRELARLVASGLVTSTSVGNQKHYQANRDAPVFAELRGLILKTVGLANPLREALRPFADRIKAAFVYGSVAKGSDTAKSDIDVLVIADRLSYRELYSALQQAEAALGRPVNPSLFTAAEWKRRMAARNSFVIRIKAQPKIFIVGTEHDIP